MTSVMNQNHQRPSCRRNTFIFIILSLVFLPIIYILYFSCKLYCKTDFFLLISILVAPSTYSILYSFKNFKLINRQNSRTAVQSVLPMDPLLQNLTFSVDQIYHHDGIVYDFYSKNDLGQSKAAHQWKIWPLPNEINQTHSIDSIEISPFVMSKLPFVDAIYVMSAPHLTDRHANLKKALHQQGIPIESIKWRMKWNRTTCNSSTSHSHVYQRLNLKDKPLGNHRKTKDSKLGIYFHG
jgi:hypothetical protein